MASHQTSNKKTKTKKPPYYSRMWCSKATNLHCLDQDPRPARGLEPFNHTWLNHLTFMWPNFFSSKVKSPTNNLKSYSYHEMF